MFERSERNQKWPTNGPIRYINHVILGVPNTLQWGTKSEVAHKWAEGLHTPCRREGPQRFKEEKEIKSGPQVRCWLHIPCRLGCPQSFRVGGKIRSCPQVGGLAT